MWISRMQHVRPKQSLNISSSLSKLISVNHMLVHRPTLQRMEMLGSSLVSWREEIPCGIRGSGGALLVQRMTCLLIPDSETLRS